MYTRNPNTKIASSLASNDLVGPLQKEIEDRRNFLLDLMAWQRDGFRNVALAATKRRLVRNQGIKAWHARYATQLYVPFIFA